MSELPIVLRYVRAVGNRDRTRIMCIYGLSAQLADVDADQRLTSLYAYDRFARHIEDAAELLPRPVIPVRTVNIELPDSKQDLGPVRTILLATPRGDAALVLDAELSGDPDGQRVAEVLAMTCLQHDQLRVGGISLTEWLRQQVGQARLRPSGELGLGPNVHQCVFPGQPLLASIRNGQSFWRLIYRVSAPDEPEKAEQEGTFREPQELNYPGFVRVGHGRGVSVISGFTPPWEDTFALVAIMLITALGVLHRSRINLFDTMRRASEAAGTSIAAARTEISRLSAQLNELQLDLEFGVESYLDSVLIPESFIEAFQRSMCEAMGVTSGMEHSSRMQERLSSVIQARQAALDAAIQEQAEKQDKAFSLVLAFGTVFALPPALLLAYFALGKDGHKVLRDVNVHWGAYMLAFLPFIALFLVGWGRRRWIRAHSTQLDVFQRERAPRGS